MALEAGPDKYFTYTWADLGDDESGAAAVLGQYADKTVQVTGTWASATLVLEGSMDAVTWFTLSDFNGDSLSFTDDGMATIAENPKYIRPTTANGSGTDVKCIIGGAQRA